MGRSQRVKGRSGEQEVARIFRAAGFDVKRVPNSGGLDVKGDLTGLRGWHIEVKRQERANIWEWIAQSGSEAPPDTKPIVIFRRNRTPWRVIIDLQCFLELIGDSVEEP